MTGEERRTNILTRPIGPLLCKMALPTIIGMLMMTIYNLTDTFFIGMLENQSMTAAIGVGFSFVSLIQAVGFWFGYGSGNNMSRLVGRGEQEEAEEMASLGLCLALITGILIVAALFFFVKPLAALLGADASPALLSYTTVYLKILLPSVPFSLFATTLYNQMRLCGNARDGMVGLLAGMLLNMILDPILIFGCSLGFAGAAWATFTGQAAGATVLLVLSFRNGNFPVNLRKARIDSERLYHILVGGAPNFSRQAITGAAAVLLNLAASEYGEDTIAALTVSGRIAALAYMIVIGWGQGFQPICAMNYGAGKYDRVRKALHLSALIGTLFLCVAAVLLWIFATPAVRLLSKNDEVIRQGAEALRITCFSLPLMGVYALSSMFTQNIGRYFTALFISVARQGIFYLPLLFLIPALFHLFGVTEPSALFCVQPISDLLAFFLGLFLMNGPYRKLSEAG